MNTIKSIKSFESCYDLLSYDYDLSEFLTEEEIDVLRYVDDYEPVSFYLINGDTVIVCDNYSGDLSGDIMAEEDFLHNMIEYAKENA